MPTSPASVPTRHPCDIFHVAEQVGIRLPPLNRAGAVRRPRECFARRTLARIGREEGEGHLTLVLRLIVESEGNGAELHSDTISSLSAIVAGGLVTVDGALFERLDRVPLSQLRTRARSIGGRLPTAHVMQVLLLLALRNELVAVEEIIA